MYVSKELNKYLRLKIDIATLLDSRRQEQVLSRHRYVLTKYVSFAPKL